MKAAILAAASGLVAVGIAVPIAGGGFDSALCSDWLAEGGSPQAAIVAVDLVPAAERGFHDHLCRGMAHAKLEQWAQARAAFERARPLAGPLAWLVDGYSGAALHAGDGGRAAAIGAWERGIAGAIGAGDEPRELTFRSHRATTNARQRRFEEALEEFALIYQRTPDPRFQAMFALQAAKAGASMNRLDLAETWAERAIAAAREADSEQIEGDALMLAGDARSRAGDEARAAEAYAEASRLLQAAGNLRAAAEAEEMAGQSLFRTGDYRSGEGHFTTAIARYRWAGGHEHAAWLEGSLRTRQARFQLGHVCFELIARRDFAAAVRAVETISEPLRSPDAVECLSRARQSRGLSPSASPLDRAAALRAAAAAQAAALARLDGAATALDGIDPTPRRPLGTPPRPQPIMTPPTAPPAFATPRDRRQD